LHSYKIQTDRRFFESSIKIHSKYKGSIIRQIRRAIKIEYRCLKHKESNEDFIIAVDSSGVKVKNRRE